VIWAFTGGSARQNPSGGLLYASDGYLYGTTFGNDLDSPQLFRIKPDGSSYSIVYSFASGTLVQPFTQGLVQGSEGALYGVISPCPVYPNGAVYRLDLGLQLPLPSIHYFEPSSAAVGSTVLIRGDHLLRVAAVSFNGVPAGATSGPIRITTINGSTTSTGTFTVD